MHKHLEQLTVNHTVLPFSSPFWKVKLKFLLCKIGTILKILLLDLLYILLTAEKLKLMLFAVFFSIDIVALLKRFILISLHEITIGMSIENKLVKL